MTFDYFADCMERNLYKGIKKTECIFINQDPKNSLKKFLPRAIDMKYKETFLSINNGARVKCVSMESMMIEGYIFLNELIQECKALGVTFVN